jgi:GalNAc-alpha-(1->4)-GalNAc-alpha-(1->3)-diNAcBac-PP-undecaprenol alpha-1,4-N-acetyl-D-galactosaminyltransferase
MALKPKKLCFVIPSLNVGGMERVMIEIANHANQSSEYDVHLIKLTKGKNFYELPDGIKLYEPDFFFSNKSRLYYSMKTFNFLLRTLRKIKPHSILSFGEMYNSFVLLTTFFIKNRVFISDRSQPDRKWGKFHDTTRELIYRRASGIVAQTSYSKDFLFRTLKHNNIKVIANPGRNFEPVTGRGEKVVITVGRLIPAKQVDQLVAMFSEINNPEWQLWIVGDGPERENIESIINKSPLRDNIKLWGSQKDVARFYSKSQIFAFTSRSEGFPNVLVEAQQFGLPCVSFDCVAGPSDIIVDGQNGFLVPMQDNETFKAKLSQLMNDESLLQKMSAISIEFSKKYEPEAIAEDYLKFITS